VPQSENRQYDAYLFDWDGTLAQTVEIWLDGMRVAYDHFGIAIADEKLAQNLGDWTAPIKNGIAERDMPEFNRILKEAGQERGALTPPLFPGVLQTIGQLKRDNKKVVLITSSERQVIDIALAHHELVEQFDLILTVDDVTTHKPDPEGILVALEKLGMQKDQAVMIGDSDKDMGAAKNAGIDSILFYPPSHELVYDRAHLVSFEPKRIITDWSEFFN